MTTFDAACRLTIGTEGPYSCEPNDPGNWTGGACGHGLLQGTAWGISAAAFPDIAIRALSQDDARALYRTQYWQPLQCDRLPAPLAGLVFDGAVNQGPGWMARALQSAVSVATDGAIGPKTLAAVASADLWTLHATIAWLREARYRRDESFADFGHGWIIRLMRVVAATSSF